MEKQLMHRSEKADELLKDPDGSRVMVLEDGIGFVRLVDYMGSDASIVQSARVSYGKGTKSYRDDTKLIDYLLRNHHTSPFEHVILTFHMKLPIFVARQLVRHRTARINEISGRYSELPNDFYCPLQVRGQDTKNKQGSSEPLESPQQVLALQAIDEGYRSAYSSYLQLLGLGVSREMARMVLPVGLYTEWYYQMDLNNLFKLLTLRMDSHAQWECQQYAKAMWHFTQLVAPEASNAFAKHVLIPRGIIKTQEDNQ